MKEDMGTWDREIESMQRFSLGGRTSSHLTNSIHQKAQEQASCTDHQLQPFGLYAHIKSQ
jgi:hypothetical protein